MYKKHFSIYIIEEIKKNLIATCPLWVIKILCFLFILLCNKKHDEAVKTAKLIKKSVSSLITMAKVQTEKVNIALKKMSLNSLIWSFVNR